jgi:amidase
MSDLELCYLTADEAMARFKARTLSPVELMQAVIRRAEAVEPKINAFPFRYFEEALDKAKQAEARFMKSDDRIRALEGLPIAVKDASYIKGKPTSHASLSMKDFVPDFTSPCNERILLAGGIVHARSATPEFSCTAYCNSRLWGVTRNPWNLNYAPGGSSGGSAASLAAGSATLATGSDIGGSIRIPASCCGVVGYKPPYGRNPIDPPFNLDFYCQTGPMARCLADTVRLQNIMCGPHPHDIATLRPKLHLPTDYKPIKDWKIAFSMDLGFFEVDPAVRANTEKALEVFKELGATIEEVDLGWDWSVLEAGLDYLTHLFGAWIAPLLEKQANDLTDYARIFAERGQKSRSSDFLRSLEKAGEIYMRFGPMMERYNLLICPTTALSAVAAEFNQVRDPVIINGKEVNPILGWVMTTPFNSLSRCPVLSLPSGRALNGVPTGIQLVGRTYCDVDVFRAGFAYERALGGWYGDKTRRPSL